MISHGDMPLADLEDILDGCCIQEALELLKDPSRKDNWSGLKRTRDGEKPWLDGLDVSLDTGFVRKFYREELTIRNGKWFGQVRFDHDSSFCAEVTIGHEQRYVTDVVKEMVRESGLKLARFEHEVQDPDDKFGYMLMSGECLTSKEIMWAIADVGRILHYTERTDLFSTVSNYRRVLRDIELADDVREAWEGLGGDRVNIMGFPRPRINSDAGGQDISTLDLTGGLFESFGTYVTREKDAPLIGPQGSKQKLFIEDHAKSDGDLRRIREIYVELRETGCLTGELSALIEQIDHVFEFGGIAVPSLDVEITDSDVLNTIARAFYKAVTNVKLPESSDLIDTLLNQGIRPEVAERVMGALDQRISGMYMMTTSTMSGMQGGGVGRLYFASENRSYVFKIHRDPIAALKEARTSTIIHSAAEHDELAQRLARRIPKHLLDGTTQQDGMYLTLAEDVTHKMVDVTAEELELLYSEIERGLDPRIVDRLYTTALFQTVMTKYGKDDVVIKLASSVPLNLDKGDLIGRFKENPDTYDQVQRNLTRMLGGYEESNAQLAERSSHQRVAICDNKDANYVTSSNLGEYLVDLGTVSTAGDLGEVDDIARIFMNKPSIVQNPLVLKAYFESFVRISRTLDPEYEPPQEFYNSVIQQTKKNGLRNAGHQIVVGGDDAKIHTYWDCAMLLDRDVA